MKKLTLQLLIFALVVCCANAQQNNKGVLNVKDYKILADGKTINTKAIQDCLNSIVKNGGGTLFFPAGKYLSGSLTVGKNTTIELANGAELIASPNIANYTTNHFIHAINADNFTLKGKGIINGSGNAFFDKDFKPLKRPEPWIVISNAKNVTISDVSLINSPSHVLVFEFCDNVKVNGINIINDFKTPNTDGIDIVSTKNVVISNCFISTGDDAICLKSKKDMDNDFTKLAEATVVNVENVLVNNCILESDDSAIKLGTGSQNQTKNCIFSNLVIRNTRFGLAMFMMDGGEFSDISFSDIQIQTGSRHKENYAIFMDIHQRLEGGKVGNINNISFTNIDIKTEGSIYISGHPMAAIKNVRLNNINTTITYAKSTEKWSKPKGNKTIKQWATCADFTKEPASVIIANTENVVLNNFTVAQTAGDMDRFGVFLKNCTNIRLNQVYGNSINKTELIFRENVSEAK